MNDPRKVIVGLPGHGLSTSAARRSKWWIKQLVTVDVSKSDGWAFVGYPNAFGATVEVPEGAWFLSYVEDVASTGRLRGRAVTLYQVDGGELVQVQSWGLDAARGWALKVRDQIAGLVNTPDDGESAGPDRLPVAAAVRRDLGRLFDRLTQASGEPDFVMQVAIDDAADTVRRLLDTTHDV